MIFTGITPDEVAAITAQVSGQYYDGNPVVEWVKNPRMAPNLLNQKGTRFRGRIVVYDSHGAGSRTSWSGRHGPWACWHVFRDVLQVVIMARGANVTTGMARYTPETWEERYPRTGTKNIGSYARPVSMLDLCNCEGGAYDAPQPLRDVDDRRPRLDVIEKRLYDLETSVTFLNSYLNT